MRLAFLGKEVRKHFFSEEKKQKTFSFPLADARRPWPDKFVPAQT
jgi:hypothetical protein